MTPHNSLVWVHPRGELKITSHLSEDSSVEVETYAGKIHVEWDPQAAVTPLGQLPFFIDFLKTADLFSPWVRDCPLSWESPNAHGKREILGTLMLSVLAGHHRYAHMATLRSDGVNPPLLGMKKAASEDSVRRALKKEERGFHYLFKLKQTSGVKRLTEKLCRHGEWVPAGQGWEGTDGSLQLQGWTKHRRVIVLRREIKNDIMIEGKEKQLAFIEMAEGSRKYESAVLVTSLDDEVLTMAQYYRDRADSENNFDELKNQWGWCGYTTHDLKRCRMMARVIALVYNWWSLFVRLAIPNKHAEAITSRPLLLQAVGKQTRHGGQTTLTLTSTHAKAKGVRRLLITLEGFLREIRANAEQLDWQGLWKKILSRVFRWFLKGRPLTPPPLLPSPT